MEKYFVPSMLLTCIIVFIVGTIYRKIDEFKLNEKIRQAKKTKMMYGIFYRLNDGTELFIIKSWLLWDANDSLKELRNNAPRMSSIFNKKDFKKICNEEFLPDRLFIKKIGYEDIPLPSYSNNGIRY